MKSLREETGYGLGEERQMMWLLWHQRLHLLRQQTHIELIVSTVNLPVAADNELTNKLMVVEFVCFFEPQFSLNFKKNVLT